MITVTMIRHPRTLWVVLALTLLSIPALGAPDQDKGGARYFVNPGQFNPAAILPAPPADGSVAALADLETVLRVQETRTAADVARAKRLENDDAFDYAESLGAWFTRENLPFTAILLKHVSSDAAAVSSLTKNLYSRRRPPALEPTVHPCVEVPKSFSYPSGHSMRAFLWAAVLSDIFPDRKEALYAQAHRAAWARVVGGVHFPSDIVGGRLLAAAIVSELEKNPEYRKAVEQARAEAAAFQDKKAA